MGEPIILALALVLAGCAGGADRPRDAGRGTDAPEVSCGTLTRCGDRCVDFQTDVESCGACDRTCVIPEAEASCVAGTCAISACENGFADCNASPDDGCERAIACSAGGACATACGTQGTQVCTDVCNPVCAPPPESCNAADDDCDGACESGLAGCRRGVHRSGGAPGHFYTTDLGEAGCCGFTVEAPNYFYVYSAPADGLQPFFRCIAGDGHHYYTTDTAADGLGGIEGTLGFVARDGRCGATPLHRLRNGAGDHFYTTSDGERDHAVSLGYTYVGIAAYVWTAP